MTSENNAKINSQLIEIIVELHVVFQDYSKISAWLKSKNLNFGGCSPLNLINKNRGHKVLEFIKNANREGEL